LKEKDAQAALALAGQAEKLNPGFLSERDPARPRVPGVGRRAEAIRALTLALRSRRRSEGATGAPGVVAHGAKRTLIFATGYCTMEKNSTPKANPALVAIQWLLALGATLGLPGLICGAPRLERLDPRQRYLFAVNHVSLLDTILMGALCWRSRCYPILVLGDKNTWHASRLKRLLSSRIGFLLDRGKINSDRLRQLQSFGQASGQFHLVVFPEGTRGDGLEVAPCKPGFVLCRPAGPGANWCRSSSPTCKMVSSKTGRFRLLGGLRKVEVHVGEPIPPEQYLPIARAVYLEFVRRNIQAFDPRHQQHVRVPSHPALDLHPAKPRPLQGLAQFRRRQEMQTLHGFDCGHARGQSFPALDTAMFRAFRTNGLAQDQPSAGTQGAAGFSQNQFLFFRRPVVQHIEQQHRVAGRKFPVEMSRDSNLTRGCSGAVRWATRILFAS